MAEGETAVNVTFGNIRINSMSSTSGVFAGVNYQCLWHSDRTSQEGFGTVRGEDNILENPYSVVTDPDSSKELLEYLEGQVSASFRKRGM